MLLDRNRRVLRKAGESLADGFKDIYLGGQTIIVALVFMRVKQKIRMAVLNPAAKRMFRRPHLSPMIPGITRPKKEAALRMATM